MAITSMKKIPLHLFSFQRMAAFKRFIFLGKFLLKFRKNLPEDLVTIGVEVQPEDYMAASFFSALFYAFIFGSLIFALTAISPQQSHLALIFGISFAMILFLLFFTLHMIHPSIIKKKIATRENKDLLFALREIVLSVESGVPLFNSLKNVSLAEYGYISRDFGKAVKKIERGVYEKDALKELAIESENEFMRRAAWQIVNSLETGANVSVAIYSIIDILEKQINREIRDYSSNLNFIMLLYMLVAAAVPSLGITFIVLLSAFSGTGTGPTTIIALLVILFFVQIIILGYVNATRPAVFGG